MSPTGPQQISKRHNSPKNIWKATKVKLVLYYVNTNSYPKFDIYILKDDREVGKTKFKQTKISGVQLGQTQ